jgi:hypothetical protein
MCRIFMRKCRLELAWRSGRICSEQLHCIECVARLASLDQCKVTLPQQCLNFLPDPQGHGSLRPTFGRDAAIGCGILNHLRVHQCAPGNIGKFS